VHHRETSNTTSRETDIKSSARPAADLCYCWYLRRGGSVELATYSLCVHCTCDRHARRLTLPTAQRHLVMAVCECATDAYSHQRTLKSHLFTN